MTECLLSVMLRKVILRPAGESPARGIVGFTSVATWTMARATSLSKFQGQWPPKFGGSASARAATRVKPEQAPKELTWVSSRPDNGQDQRRCLERTEARQRIHRGSWAQRAHKDQNGTQEICRGVLAPYLDGVGQRLFGSRPRQKSDELIVAMKPGNAGGAKGLWFGVHQDEPSERGSA